MSGKVGNASKKKTAKTGCVGREKRSPLAHARHCEAHEEPEKVTVWGGRGGGNRGRGSCPRGSGEFTVKVSSEGGKVVTSLPERVEKERKKTGKKTPRTGHFERVEGGSSNGK